MRFASATCLAQDLRSCQCSLNVAVQGLHIEDEGMLGVAPRYDGLLQAHAQLPSASWYHIHWCRAASMGVCCMHAELAEHCPACSIHCAELLRVASSHDAFCTQPLHKRMPLLWASLAAAERRG